ncbi:MAG: hypothetical protein M3P45_03860 [Acidobacteriota bacterium]|nr:hypothetical protein [Acidobacteriota bacterium]
MVCAEALAVSAARADEIRLKDGKKLYGVIVAYEDNMFRVKTDFGFVLVEKDKIAAIIPTGTAAPKAEAAPAKKPVDKPGAAPQIPAASAAPKKEPVAVAANPAPASAPKSASAEKVHAATKAAPATSVAAAGLDAKPASTAQPAAEKKPNSAPAAIPKTANGSPTKPAPGGSKAAAAGAATAAATTSSARPAVPVVTAIAPPGKPAPEQPPVNRESVAGNVYTNYTHGFRMYKPPSWKLIDDARKTIPNAIVAMGTANESTLMVFGEEKSKKALEVTATDVEARLRDTYGNYRRISQRKTVAGGFPAIEIHYRGLADDHDWSGTLLIVSRSGDMFSIVGMTYSDTDLIQIQENVIARAMASLEFTSN